MQSRRNSNAIRCIIDVILMQNLDAIRTDLEMHLIILKLDQNINQKPDQTRSKLDAIQMQFRCNIGAILMQLDAL